VYSCIQCTERGGRLPSVRLSGMTSGKLRAGWNGKAFRKVAGRGERSNLSRSMPGGKPSAGALPRCGVTRAGRPGRHRGARAAAAQPAAMTIAVARELAPHSARHGWGGCENPGTIDMPHSRRSSCAGRSHQAAPSACSSCTTPAGGDPSLVPTLIWLDASFIANTSATSIIKFFDVDTL